MTQPIDCLTPCPVCGSTSAQAVAHTDGKTGEPLTTVCCDGCGLGRIDPLPTPQELEAWYTNRYRQDYKSAVQPALRHVLRAGRNALNRWTWLQGELNRLGRSWAVGASTLDIGASSGEFVHLMRHQGFDAHGIEPHAGYAAHAQQALGLAVQNGSLQQLLPQTSDQRFDLISMFHVLEHLTDPVDTLQALRRKAKTGGLLLIEVPNATRFCAPHYMFFRAHTLYFTQTSLHQTLAAAGWQVVAHNTAGDDNLMVLAQAAYGEAQPSPNWQPDDALVRAQRQRTWPRYLVDQLVTGRFLGKLSKRHEEKKTARAFASARALLDALYSHPRDQGPTPPARLSQAHGWVGLVGAGLAAAGVVDG